MWTALKLAPWIPIMLLAATSACGNGVTDWDAEVAAIEAPAAFGQHEATLVALAMYEAVNSIERRYQPYIAYLPVVQPTSREAAVAAAAANVLAVLHPEAANRFHERLTTILGDLSQDPTAVAHGTELGESAARAILVARGEDGFSTADGYRPKTKPGQYIPTGPVVGSALPFAKPFVIRNPEQFRPGPPPLLTSPEWAEDYREVKELGAKQSARRTAEQTETARFWLMTGSKAYHPLARQIIAVRNLDLVDSARFLAVYAMALSDAYLAVFDAKYKYEFWRPITAIRNGDHDGNRATGRDPTWEPIDATPMHPEYPCAHCILSGAAAEVIMFFLGAAGTPELYLTSPTAPGVTHHWKSLDNFTEEVANARVWAGFHYRSSTRVGTAMGRQVGHYVATHALLPPP